MTSGGPTLPGAIPEAMAPPLPVEGPRPVPLPLAVGAMVLSAACWGLATVLAKDVLAVMPPFPLLAIQLTASVLFLWLAVAVTRAQVPPQPVAGRAAATGLLEPGLAYGLGVPGLALTSATNASIIGAVEPVLIVLVAWVLLGSRPDGRLVVAVLVATLGVALVSLTGLGKSSGGHVGGDALVLLGTLFAALYAVLSSRTVLHVAPLSLAALQQSAGLAAALVLLAASAGLQGLAPGPDAWWSGIADPRIVADPRVLAVAALSGVVQYALPFWFYLIGIRGLPVAVAGLFLTLIPVFGVGGAVLFLGEGFALLQALGAVLTIGALVTVARRTG